MKKKTERQYYSMPYCLKIGTTRCRVNLFSRSPGCVMQDAYNDAGVQDLLAHIKNKKIGKIIIEPVKGGDPDMALCVSLGIALYIRKKRISAVLIPNGNAISIDFAPRFVRDFDIMLPPHKEYYIFFYPIDASTVLRNPPFQASGRKYATKAPKDIPVPGEPGDRNMQPGKI